jgi:hypothetical protein
MSVKLGEAHWVGGGTQWYSSLIDDLNLLYFCNGAGTLRQKVVVRAPVRRDADWYTSLICRSKCHYVVRLCSTKWREKTGCMCSPALESTKKHPWGLLECFLFTGTLMPCVGMSCGTLTGAACSCRMFSLFGNLYRRS